MAANNTTIVLVPYGGSESFEEFGIFVGTFLSVELLGLAWAYFVLKYSLRRASFFADICGGFYDMIFTWITWGSMARASSIGGLCSAAYEEEDASGSVLWSARGATFEGYYLIAMLFVMDVVGLKTVYYAFASALDLIETKQEEEEEEANAKCADDDMVVVAAIAASAGATLDGDAAPPPAGEATGVEQRQSRDTQRDSNVHDLIEVEMSCIEIQEGMVSTATSRFFKFVHLVVDKRQRRDTIISRFLYLATGVLVPLAGMATSAMYPASEGVINARALDEAPCVAGFDAISRLPPLIVLSGAIVSVIIQMIAIPLFALILRLFGYALRSPVLFVLSVTVSLFTVACIVAGVTALAQAASGVAGVLSNLSFRFTHFSFSAAISLHPFSAPALLVVRTFRVVVLMALAALRHTSCFQTGKVFYDDSGAHPRCDSVIGVLQRVNNTVCAAVLVISEILSVVIVSLIYCIIVATKCILLFVWGIFVLVCLREDVNAQ